MGFTDQLDHVIAARAIVKAAKSGKVVPPEILALAKAVSRRPGTITFKIRPENLVQYAKKEGLPN